MEIKELKNNYAELAEKYKLPSFKELNENFEIEKIDKDTECLLRIIRKVMMEKIVNSLSFLEMLNNPVNAPRIYLQYIKSISVEDKKDLDSIYSSLGEISLHSLDLEIDYSEKKEAEIIKRIFNTWNSVKPKFRLVLNNIKKPNGNIAKREKTYFG